MVHDICSHTSVLPSSTIATKLLQPVIPCIHTGSTFKSWPISGKPSCPLFSCRGCNNCGSEVYILHDLHCPAYQRPLVPPTRISRRRITLLCPLPNNLLLHKPNLPHVHIHSQHSQTIPSLNLRRSYLHFSLSCRCYGSETDQTEYNARQHQIPVILSVCIGTCVYLRALTFLSFSTMRVTWLKESPMRFFRAV